MKQPPSTQANEYWQSTVCPFCGVGCGMRLQVRDGKIAALTPDFEHPVSQGQLCAKGWNTLFALDASTRITSPLIKEGNSFRKATWEETLTYIANELNDTLKSDGPHAVGVISSARATNEDNYAAQKFARAVLKTNNVDHCARICHSPSVSGLTQTLGSGAMTNSVTDIDKADLIFIIGADPTVSHTILGGRIIKAVTNGAKLVVVDPRETQLAQLANIHLRLRSGTNIALLNGLINIIFNNNWQNTQFLEERVEQVNPLKEHVASYTPEKTAAITGISIEQLTEAAKLYSQSPAAFLAYGMGITQFTSGTNNVIAVSNLALTCGQLGRSGTGINPLRGQNNVQGACDMGCLPNVYPGYQNAAAPETQEKFSKTWNTPVAQQAGLTSLGMAKAALDNQLRAMIIIGEDPVVTDPDQNQVSAALKEMDLLIVLEMNMTETAKLADIILPAASFAEKNGTFTNCERRVQRVHKAIDPPGDCLPDWLILSKLAEKMGSTCMNWQSANEIFDEMASLTPIFSAMNYTKLDKQHGLQWPCDGEHPEGSAILHRKTFPIGKARLIPVNYVPPAETPDEEYPFVFTTNRLHCHYGCGSMTRKSPLLERETPDGLLFINPQDAADLQLQNHAPIGVRSRRGFLETRAIFSEHIPRGLVAMPYHFREAPSNQLTNNAEDPVTHMPELKACAVQIEPLPKDYIPRPIQKILEEQTQ